jgi:hypothetical protein
MREIVTHPRRGERRFELKLQGGRRILWDGTDGEQACRNYELGHEGAVVVAWRNYPRHGLAIGLGTIIEPGDYRWDKPQYGGSGILP